MSRLGSKIFATAAVTLLAVGAAACGDDDDGDSGVSDGLRGYSGQSVGLMRVFGGTISLATIAFVTLETLRQRK